MSGIRARRAVVGALGRAVFELRSATRQCEVFGSPAMEELFRHVGFPAGGVPSRSFGSFLSERLSRQYGVAQVKDSGKFIIGRRWFESKALPQVGGCVNALHLACTFVADVGRCFDYLGCPF